MGLTTQQISAINKLGRCKSDKRRLDLIKKGGQPMQKTLRECAYNLLKGNVPMSAQEKKRLKPYASKVRTLSRKSTPMKKRLQIEQKGGFVLALLKPILTALGGELIGQIGTAIFRRGRKKK
jgi:hypothetical protein